MMLSLCDFFSVKRASVLLVTIEGSLISKVQYLQRAKFRKQAVCVCTALQNVHSLFFNELL